MLVLLARKRDEVRPLVRPYVKGLVSGDFEPVFRAPVGETPTT